MRLPILGVDGFSGKLLPSEYAPEEVSYLEAFSEAWTTHRFLEERILDHVKDIEHYRCEGGGHRSGLHELNLPMMNPELTLIELTQCTLAGWKTQTDTSAVECSRAHGIGTKDINGNGCVKNGRGINEDQPHPCPAADRHPLRCFCWLIERTKPKTPLRR